MSKFEWVKIITYSLSYDLEKTERSKRLKRAIEHYCIQFKVNVFFHSSSIHQFLLNNLKLNIDFQLRCVTFETFAYFNFMETP